MIFDSFGAAPPSTTGLVGFPSMLLSDVAATVAHLKVVEPDLPAGEIRIAAVPARVPLTRASISTSDQPAARRLGGALRLDDDRASQHGGPDWTGFIPGLVPTARTLRVDLVLEGEASGPSITLAEASELLDLLDAAVPTEISVARVVLRSRDGEDHEAEIQTIHSRDARALSVELAGLSLPLRTVVHSLAPSTLPDHPMP
jgi:hypothetical protein